MDVGMDSANVFPIFENMTQKPLAITFTSVILLLSTIKVIVYSIGFWLGASQHCTGF